MSTFVVALDLLKDVKRVNVLPGMHYAEPLSLPSLLLARTRKVG